MTRSRYEEILIGPKNQGKSKVNPNHNMFKAVVQARQPTWVHFDPNVAWDKTIIGGFYLDDLAAEPTSVTGSGTLIILTNLQS